jgi:antitoxin (DNA-binding transcriptional repressor) of toxin-antitoxin stability system
MEFVPYRVLRNQPSELRKKLDEKGELVVTVDGEPMAVMLQIPKGSLEDLVLLLSQVRAQLAAATIREQARKSGLNNMTVVQADKLVKETRAARRGDRPVNAHRSRH